LLNLQAAARIADSSPGGGIALQEYQRYRRGEGQLNSRGTHFQTVKSMEARGTGAGGGGGLEE